MGTNITYRAPLIRNQGTPAVVQGTGHGMALPFAADTALCSCLTLCIHALVLLCQHMVDFAAFS